MLLCPNLDYSLFNKYEIDGSHKNICLIFIAFFKHHEMYAKAFELK